MFIIKPDKEEIRFQIIDIYTQNMKFKNEDNSSDSDDFSDEENKYQLDRSEYKIMIFGKDENDYTYSVLVNDFTPYFYLKVPDNFTKDKIKYLEDWIKENMWKKYEEGLERITLHQKMSFRGFTNKKKFNFVRLVFRNTNAMNNCINLFQNKTWNSTLKKFTKILPKKITIQGVTEQPYYFDLYENMIDPMIRFIHHREIKPVGWITIPKNKYTIRKSEHETHCNININTRWTNIKYNNNENNVAIKIMAYDIECDSSHGDFPLPRKEYLKLTREIVIEYERIQKIIFNKDSNNVDELKRLISNKKMFVKKLINFALNDGSEKFNINKVYIKFGFNIPNEKVIDIVSSNISKILLEYDPCVKTFDRNKQIDKSIEAISKILNNNFPPLEGDKTIQIGISFIKYGSNIPYKNLMYTLGSCENIENTKVVSFNNEKDLLLAFNKLVIQEDPEIITGYNINGFDTPWLMKRAHELDIEEDFCKLSRIKDYKCILKEKQEKSAIGQLIKVEFVDIPGRIQLDILKLVQKSYNLDSYKLDSVSANFIQGDIEEISKINDKTIIKTNNLKGLNKNNFIIFIEQDGYLENKYLDGKKFEIQNIGENNFIINENIELDLNKKCIWCLGKDDVSPQDIFDLQKGSSHDRYIIAKYCMMDVILCIELLLKLELLTNSIGMANVCLIPLNWSIHRGQGVKLLSLVTEILRKENYLLPYLYKSLISKEGYEGAIVLPPYPGIYLNDPVAVLDYASLYPSSMIMGNLSHETICEDEKWLGDIGIENLRKLGYGYYDVEFDRYQTTFTSSGSIKEKKKIGKSKVRFVQYPNNEKGLIPRTLQYLLNARKTTRKKINYKTITLKNGEKYSGIKNESDQNTIIIVTDKNDKIEINKDDIIDITETYNKFQKNILDGLQLAFKITANSLYGQIGARVSDLFYREIAASTTSIGRQQLDIAQTYCENKKHFPKILDNGETIYLNNKCVYGDTDSVFVKFDCRYNNGEKMIGKEALAETIKLAKIAESGIKKILMKPQDLEYEKTFWPFILFTKKRYVGNKYEFDIDKYKQTSMGIVTKRRDNAPICKVIFGGIIDIIMKEKKITPSIDFLRKNINNLINSKFNLDALIISKTLSSYYKDPDRVAHKVLADRMAQRDPGNKPQINDRIPFIYVEIDEKIKGSILQGDKIENPDYIKKNNLSPDYEFYITNQIMKPVCQIYGLCLEYIPGYIPNTNFNELQITYEKTIDRVSATKKILEKKQQIAGDLLFGEVLRKLQNKRIGNVEISKWFTPQKSNTKKYYKPSYYDDNNSNEECDENYDASGFNI